MLSLFLSTGPFHVIQILYRIVFGSILKFRAPLTINPMSSAAHPFSEIILLCPRINFSCITIIILSWLNITLLTLLLLPVTVKSTQLLPSTFRLDNGIISCNSGREKKPNNYYHPPHNCRVSTLNDQDSQ